MIGRALVIFAMVVGPMPARSGDDPPLPEFAQTFSYLAARDGLGPGVWRPRASTERRPKGGDDAYNGEFQFFLDPEYAWSNGYSPFAIVDGALRIRAARTADLGFAPGEIPSDPATGRPYPWVSGILTSRASFSQHGGYFEVEAQMPKGQGIWPAFWMLPIDERHPPEIDVVEYLGHRPREYHVAALMGRSDDHDAYLPADVDLSAGFHRYGVLWTDRALTFFLDRRARRTVDITDRADLGRSFYLILNLSVGSRGLDGFVPPPDDSTPNPADLLVRSVRTWQGPGPTGVVLSAASVMETAVPGTRVGKLSTTSVGPLDGVQYSIVDNPDGRFAVRGADLLSAAPFDFARQRSYAVSIAATDRLGRTWRQRFDIAVLDAGRMTSAYAGRTVTDSAWRRENLEAWPGLVDVDGKPTATFLREAAEAGPYGFSQSVAVRGGPPTRYVVSADIRPLGRGWVKAEVSTADYRKNVQVFFDLNRGVLGDYFASAAPAGEVPFRLDRRPVIAPLPNGFYRCEVDLVTDGSPALRTTWQVVADDDEQAGGHRADPAFDNGTGHPGRGVVVSSNLRMLGP